MSRMDGGVWLVTGVQAAGKSTVADLLAAQFERGVHIRGGQFYRWVVRGWVHVDGEPASEARRLLDLRYRLSARVADEYSAAGFAVVVQDNIFGADISRWFNSIAARPRHLVVLRPSVAAIAAREEARRQKAGKVAYREGAPTIEALDDLLATTPRVGLWLDTSNQEPEQTVTEILNRVSETLVDAQI
jgi:hypothetical protein